MACFPGPGVQTLLIQDQAFSCPRWFQLRQDLSCDPGHGQFGCSLALLPALIAILVLITWLSKPLIRFRPQWTKPFIQELADVHKSKITRSTTTLLILIPFGLALQLVTALYPFPTLTAVLLVLPWLIATLIVTINRPSTVPFGLLAITGSLGISRLAVAFQWRSDPKLALPFLIVLLIVLTIFRMPFRSPTLSRDSISPAFAVPTHALRSPEDNLTLWQFLTVSWMSPLISVGAARQLDDKDVWSLSFEFQHKALHETFRTLKGTVVRRLLVANGIDLVIITAFGILETLSYISTPILLQRILLAMESSSRRQALTFALLSLLVRLVSTQSSILNIWFGRRCYERSRGEMITMIFEKTLNRKIVAPSHDSEPKESDEQTNGQNHTKTSVVARWWSALVKPRNWFAKKPNVKEPASMGKILNLMRNDVYEVAQRFWEFDALVVTPLTLILSVVLIWKLIGWPCLIGVLTIFVSQGINALITKYLLKRERLRRKATDIKLQKITQFVEAIRHLRWYGWQDFWAKQIMDSRQRELNLMIVTKLVFTAIEFVNTFASGLFPVVAFYAYTVWAGLPLRIDIAFPALQLFSRLEESLRGIPDLITTLLNAKIAVDRIEDFLSEPDKQLAETRTEASTPTLINASFAWPGSHLVLHNITLEFPIGLTVIFGKVAAGKTALLQSLLGELDKLEGEAHIPNLIGYCAQTPWLQSMSIRDNILFSSPLDDIRYKQVIEACALNQDFASFPHGDLSNIGENGIGLSGGQKARVALARAVYSRAMFLLLDDPLSALDHDTASTIVRKLFNGPLVKGRTIVLVTHRTQLCQPLAIQMVEVVNGRAKVDNTPDMPPGLGSDANQIQDQAGDQIQEQFGDQTQDQVGSHELATAQMQDDPVNFTEDEKRQHGSVKASVYWEYIKAGQIKWWALLICVLILGRLVDIGETWFLKQWGESYNSEVIPSGPSVITGLSTPSITGLSTPSMITTGLLDTLPSPEENIRPWLLGFLLLAAAHALMFFMAQCVMMVIVYFAGRHMFKEVMNRVSHATFRFYDVTPVGRLMNRMTSDIGTVDGNISSQFEIVARLFIQWLASIFIIASVTPVFLVFAILITTSFAVIFNRFLPTSQSLRRLEMVSLSPLMSNFGALVEGLVTVRAFNVQSRFQDGVIQVTDAFQKMDHFYWSLQAWLMYRFEALSAISTFLITALALFTGLSPGLTAFVLRAANEFVSATHGLCRIYGSLQMNFVSVERVIEMLHLDQEPLGDIDPPAAWPYRGHVEFEDVTIRYAPHLDPSLSNVSLRVPAGSTAAILGRTGSGKSTLALSLLATVRPESGRILIDGIDISRVNTLALRNRLTFLAQDPVLFPGSMRENLDPLQEYTDEACEAVLGRVCAAHNWDIKTEIEVGGKNLSQGQRQLVGLARAVLRRSSIVILDEATASIDMETALQIQQILREEMTQSTVLTIAHRLEAVKDANYFIRLDKGRVIAHGAADTVDRLA